MLYILYNHDIKTTVIFMLRYSYSSMSICIKIFNILFTFVLLHFINLIPCTGVFVLCDIMLNISLRSSWANIHTYTESQQSTDFIALTGTQICVCHNHKCNKYLFCGFFFLIWTFSLENGLFGLLFFGCNRLGIFNVSNWHMDPYNCLPLSKTARCLIHYPRIRDASFSDFMNR